MKAFSLPYVEIGDTKFAIIESNEFHQHKYLSNQGFYEAGMLSYIRENYSGGNFIDIGACLGNHSIYFSNIADKVYSFEPLKGNYMLFSLNMLLNNSINIESFNVALGDKDEIKEINREQGIVQGSASFTHPTEKANIKERVIVKRLDDFNIKDVKVIKIDVEEYNIPVLEGAKKTILKYKPVLFIESALNLTHKATKEFMENIGYEENKRVFNATPTYLYTPKEVEKK